MHAVASRISAGLHRFFSPRSFAAVAAVPALMMAGHYTVHSGDTLSSIAQRYCGNAGDYPALAAASGISNPNSIYTGERVTLDCHHAAAHAGPPPVLLGYNPDPSGVLDRAQVGDLWLNAGGPSWAEWDAEQIAYCESGWNTRAYNPSGASGIWQILGQVSPGWVFDARVNARNAVIKFENAGDRFTPWVCQA